MSNIDKRALREAAEKAISEEGETWWNEEQLASDYGLALHRPDAKFIAAANPATVLALLDELEAKDKRIADYTDETADPALAKNWATDVDVLPIFEGDVNTKLSAAAAGKGE